MPVIRRMSYPLGSVTAGTILNTPNTTTFLTPSASSTGDLQGLTANAIPVGQAEYIALDFNISAISGASAALTVTVDRLGEDGVWYNIYSSGAKNTTGATSAHIGIGGATNVEIGRFVRVGFFLSNTTTPSVTLSASVDAKS